MPPCGIVAYCGSEHNVVDLLVSGLERLEYRGYDSAGVGVAEAGAATITRVRSVGKVKNLKAAVQNLHDKKLLAGIAHTRWATHGVPSETNCHPLANGADTICVVHNGIVENYESLRQQLIAHGYKFKSQTDTEVLAHLLDDTMTKFPDIHLSEAVRLALTQIEGTFGLAILCSKFPGVIVGARRGSPLIVGVSKETGEHYLCSDAAAIIQYTPKVIYLADNQIVTLKVGAEPKVITIDNEHIPSEIVTLALERSEIEKGGYKHFMIKEIHDQPRVLTGCMRGRVTKDETTTDVRLGGFNDPEMSAAFDACDRLIICACGTSWHAAMVGEYLIEDLCRIPVEVEYASEFRYRNPILRANKDIVMAISQSGETADTQAAIAQAKENGCKTFALVNTVGSTIARDVDAGIYLRAGPEIGVASTKAFTAQVFTLALFAVKLGRQRGTLSKEKAAEVLRGLRDIPAQIETVIKTNMEPVKMAARVFRYATNFLYLGRGYNFPVALEGALKLKEISYIHAEGYPAAEMKHGPIALIDVMMPVVFIAPKNDSSYAKVKSNIEEVITRKGTIIVVTDEGNTDFDDRAEFVFKIPMTSECLYPLLTVVPLQLLSYFIADLRQIDVDRPRNLAKSVTVE